MVSNREKAPNIVEIIRQRECRILVIDDDDRFRGSFSFLLERKFNASVQGVNSGLAALEKLRSGASYDLIFVDIMMPLMSGIETYKHLREAGTDTKIVFMSAFADSEEWNRAQGIKGSTTLQKPISESHLLMVLSGSLEE
jgi:CheY-like chemotaxis protein